VSACGLGDPGFSASVSAGTCSSFGSFFSLIDFLRASKFKSPRCRRRLFLNRRFPALGATGVATSAAPFLYLKLQSTVETHAFILLWISLLHRMVVVINFQPCSAERASVNTLFIGMRAELASVPLISLATRRPEAQSGESGESLTISRHTSFVIVSLPHKPLYSFLNDAVQARSQ